MFKDGTYIKEFLTTLTLWSKSMKPRERYLKEMLKPKIHTSIKQNR